MRASKQVVVVGASGFGREALDVIQAMQGNGTSVEVVGVVDDAPSLVNLERLADRQVLYLGTIEEWLANDVSHISFVLGIGNPDVRRRLAERMESAGMSPFTAIHPSAIIGSRSNLGPGAVVCAGAVIATNVQFGQYVHINPNVTIGHDAVLHDYVSINPAAVISGEVSIQNEVLVGAAAIVLQNLTVGERTIVGAAALVTKNVPKSVVVTGVPGAWNE
ncbi:acetyltransferase [Corynebacterium comes]|uniref:Acetyltransferase EpsM n=1 Tax=Corynebacterium comes TaxID=2675218 RepID=A0A6B8WEM3_9CORY|nr:acetyltransferase [Corynebacterium comes]QGU05148.1 Putative acetyltransferase EpsM [Corynebacterium comes]